MTTPLTWDELREKQKQKILLMIIALEEFRYGYDRALSHGADQTSAVDRFYTNGLIQYCANFFLSTPNLTKALSAVGCDHFADPVRAVLSEKIGEVSFGQVIKTFRNQWLVHPRFSSRILEDKEGAPLIDFDDEAVGMLIGEKQARLFAHTRSLWNDLIDTFPEVVAYRQGLEDAP